MHEPDHGEVMDVERDREEDEDERDGVAAGEPIGGAPGADEVEQCAGGATEATIGLRHKERSDEAERGDGQRGDSRGADNVGGEGFEVGEIEGQREQCHHEGEEEQGAGKIFEAANDIGGKRDAKTRRAVVTQKFLGRTVRAEMVSIEWIASGEGDEGRGAGDERECGRARP